MRVDADGAPELDMDPGFWSIDLITGHDRFDMLFVGEAILLRACPYTYAEWHGRPLSVDPATPYRDHPEDAAFTEDSHCGLTKWVCSGCGAASITLHEDRFPGGWIEVARCKRDGDTEASTTVCSVACLAVVADAGWPGVFRAPTMPGFPRDPYEPLVVVASPPPADGVDRLD